MSLEHNNPDLDFAVGTVWVAGKGEVPLVEVTDFELQLVARVAWDVCDGPVLRGCRREAARRGVQVI